MKATTNKDGVTLQLTKEEVQSLSRFVTITMQSDLFNLQTRPEAITALHFGYALLTL